jgi:hypothetical protein
MTFFGFILIDQAETMMESIEAFADAQGVNQNAMKNVARSWLSFVQLVHRGSTSLAHIQEDLQKIGIAILISILDYSFFSLFRSDFIQV